MLFYVKLNIQGCRGGIPASVFGFIGSVIGYGKDEGNEKVQDR